MTGTVSSGLLLLVLGFWLLTMTLVGDLPGRIISYSPVGS